MHTLRPSCLLVTELIIVIAVGATVVATLILPKAMFHFQELVVTMYTNGTTDFSANVTPLVSSLGIVSLLTLIFGIAIGAAMSLTASSIPNVHKKPEEEYEDIVRTAGFMKITTTAEGKTYQLTELGHRFLRDYAFLNRELITTHGIKETLSKTKPK